MLKNVKKGDPLSFLTLQFVAKYQTLEGGAFGDKKISKKSQCRKNERVDPSVSSGFANARKSLAKARTRTRDRSVPAKPIKVCVKKWYIQGELCGLTKKASHCNSRTLLSQEKRVCILKYS